MSHTQALTPQYPTGTTRIILVLTAISCALLELIDATVVNVSLREISGSIGATTTEIAWVVTAYAISNVIIIPLTGMLSSYFGRKNYFTASVIIFTFASLMCGLSTSLWTLVFWRFVQGLGGGGLLSTAQTIIMGAFPPEKIGMATAIFGMGIILGPTFGPTIGGLITDNFSWNWIFFVNVPIGIVAAFLAFKFVGNDPFSVKPKRIDYWGILFLVVAVGSIQYVLEEGTSKDWFDSKEIILFTCLAVAGIVSLIWRELSIDYPAVNLRLYKNYNLVLGSILNFLLGLILFGSVFIFPLFVQISLGWTATKTGLFMIPGALCSAFTMPIVGKMLGKGVNPKKIIIFGASSTVIFLMMLSFSSPGSSQGDFYLPFVLRGIGMACMMSPIISLAVVGLKGKDIGQAVGLSNMVRQLGGSVGIALINLFLIQKNAQVRGSMLGYVNDYSQQSVERMAAIKQNFLSKGFSMEEAEAMALRSLEGAIGRQQALVSYDQGFFAVGLMVLIIFPVVLMVRYKKTKKAKVISDAH
ncbi:MAG: DHA2 family efflux MFS transporter permease subunit [Flavobacteriia bacterium]|nr:DHA2 family efflux MFS transporter permease subunit [Flavobacteriia bacterium]NBV67682.1 DHA2 family efflux MFS transporter permease subunit [Flavobacteriia bacterium]